MCRYILPIILFFLANTLSAEENGLILDIVFNGKPAYLIHAGEFSSQKSASDAQNLLASTLKQTVSIEHNVKTDKYIVNVGPVNDKKEAENIAQELQQSKVQALSPLSSNGGAVMSSLRDIPKSTADPSPAAGDDVPKATDEVPKHVNDAAPVAKTKIWNLRNADIRAVIAEISRITGKNFIVDPRVQGKISVVSATPITDEELYPVFLSMLQVSGFAAITSNNVVKVIPSSESKAVLSDNNSNNGDEIMVQVFNIKNVPAEQLVPVIRPLMPQWSNVAAYGPSNMLILSGRANNIQQLATIIKQVDISSAHGIDIVTLDHALAMDIVNTLKDIIKSQSSASTQNQTTLAADDRSNSILIGGSKTERIRLRLLIAKLDKKNNNLKHSNTQVIYLNYLRAEDFVPILAGIAQANFSGNVGTTIGNLNSQTLDITNPYANNVSQDPGKTIADAKPANLGDLNTQNSSGQNTGSNKPSMQIIAEPNTNTIILNGPAALIAILKDVVKQLDIRPAQLLIEALVAEVNESDFNNLGIEWGSIGQGAADRSSFRPGFAIINSKISIEQFEAQIHALARAHKANILSTPSVVVLDNRQAKILIGKQVSVAASTSPGTSNSTGIPFTTYDRVNVALHLYVRPQITQGNGIQMQIDQGNDTLDSTSDSTYPTFNISAIVTSVHVESGDIVVLGGLAQDRIADDTAGIPILSDLPFVGKVFQRKVDNHEKKILMVFIKPRILNSELSSVNATNQKYSSLRKEQIRIVKEQLDEDNKYSHNHASILPAVNSSKLPEPFTKNLTKKASS
jgi:general secretion pathway protein D